MFFLYAMWQLAYIYTCQLGCQEKFALCPVISCAFPVYLSLCTITVVCDITLQTLHLSFLLVCVHRLFGTTISMCHWDSALIITLTIAVKISAMHLVTKPICVHVYVWNSNKTDLITVARIVRCVFVSDPPWCMFQTYFLLLHGRTEFLGCYNFAVGENHHIYLEVLNLGGIL